MRIVSIQHEPLEEVPFLNAGRRGRQYYEDRLPILLAEARGLPAELDAVIATADLQGRETFKQAGGGQLRLLGEVLPEKLIEVAGRVGLNDPRRIGVLLGGDFYTVPALDKRGGSGDVTNVWLAFSDVFKWSAGVAGNHDTFGPDRARPKFGRGLHYLDGERAVVDQLRIAGLGGIMGDPRRLQRRTEQDYLECLELLLMEPCDVLVMHDGPDAPEQRLQGSSAVRELVEQYRPPLVVRGHSHWKRPLVELAGGTQVLNVDARAVILRKSRKDPAQSDAAEMERPANRKRKPPAPGRAG